MQQRLGFFEAPYIAKVSRVVVGLAATPVVMLASGITISCVHGYRLTMQTLTTKLDNSSILKDAREAAEMAA